MLIWEHLAKQLLKPKISFKHQNASTMLYPQRSATVSSVRKTIANLKFENIQRQLCKLLPLTTQVHPLHSCIDTFYHRHQVHEYIDHLHNQIHLLHICSGYSLVHQYSVPPAASYIVIAGEF